MGVASAKEADLRRAEHITPPDEVNKQGAAEHHAWQRDPTKDDPSAKLVRRSRLPEGIGFLPALPVPARHLSIATISRGAAASGAEGARCGQAARLVHLLGMRLPDMGADTRRDLMDHRFGGRKSRQCVQEPEIVNGPIVAR